MLRIFLVCLTGFSMAGCFDDEFFRIQQQWLEYRQSPAYHETTYTSRYTDNLGNHVYCSTTCNRYDCAQQCSRY